MKQSDLAIGWLHRDSVHPLFMTSVQGIRDHEDGYVKTIDIHSSPKVDMGRNELFRIWLEETSCTRLLMLDDDMAFEPDVAKRLRSTNKDLVGGLYFQGGWKSPVKPAITQVYETDEGAIIQPFWDYPVDTLVEVAGLGGGFMMIHRRVAEAVLEARGADHPMIWFAHGMHNGVPIGEDVAFCITAAVCGFQPWCDTSLEAWHMKSMPVTSQTYVTSLLNKSHPVYNQRQAIPVFQERGNGYSRVSSRSGVEGLSET